MPLPHLNLLQLLMARRATVPPSPSSPSAASAASAAPLPTLECPAGCRWVSVRLDRDASPVIVAVPLGPVDPTALFRPAPSPSPDPADAAFVDSLLAA